MSEPSADEIVGIFEKYGYTGCTRLFHQVDEKNQICSVCAVGALIREHFGEEGLRKLPDGPLFKLSVTIQVPLAWIIGLMHGFDGDSTETLYFGQSRENFLRGHTVGVEVRRRVFRLEESHV
ncbi:hypothetical protein [Nitrolancea hollandica]|uniref:Uncharacterized protein n=1 Tax=Nitrolancea hollandica Lb TaxID=1129897 RepID=I4EL32_9BACT|nr:hypothetical protein [Nitrolancea hollandica]CCF85394.1 hypothetical protein NITHO_4920005 [Nitrolancea hollandica Lb]